MEAFTFIYVYMYSYTHWIVQELCLVAKLGDKWASHSFMSVLMCTRAPQTLPFISMHVDSSQTVLEHHSYTHWIVQELQYLCLVAKLGDKWAVGNVVQLVLLCRVTDAPLEVISWLDVHGSKLLLTLSQRKTEKNGRKREHIIIWLHVYVRCHGNTLRYHHSPHVC